MGVTKNQILQLLPPYRNKWQVIRDQQYVPDIIREVCDAHIYFSKYYDQFAWKFAGGSVDEICSDLYTWVKQNITYREESIERQTTAIPTGILLRGKGDCKHYALFIAGVLDSLRRRYGYNIPWCYYFAAYDRNIDEPYHVFVAATAEDGVEVWCDPTPGIVGLTPTILEKRVVYG